MPWPPIDEREICDPAASAAFPPLPRGLEAGVEVGVRGARWHVDTTVAHADCCELHLRAAAGGVPAGRVLLWPFDRPQIIGRHRRVSVLALRRWVRHAGSVLAGELDPLTPRTRFHGQVLPYQLAPAAAMAGGASRVLLADEVGLGKTVQAGWIVSDLLTREPGARALIAVPAGLRDQWASELAARFDLAPERVDAGWLRRAVADRPADVSPWAAPGTYLASIDFLKQPDVARSLDAVIWDLLVVDEAHAAASPTERHAMLALVASAARRVVVITATPYSGDSAGFASMADLGAIAGEPPPLMFRRSREDVGDGRTRRHRFAPIRITPAERRLQRLLERYSRAVWRGAPADVERARLAMTVLRKRALSSPAAVGRTLARRLELLRGDRATPGQLALFEEEPESDDSLPETALSTPGLGDAARERQWLLSAIEAATAAGGGDSKRRYLLRLLGRVGGEAVVVFTEYRDTLRQLARVLPDACQLHGGLTSSERTAVQRRFNTEGGVLLATDAAAEGLNLQQRARLLINYELPWNPARLEQRVGRVDRIGQRRRVHAISLVARDTAEDLVIANLARRLSRVAATLGERDRLASLLTEARTARAVIARTPLDRDDGLPTVQPLARAAAADFPVERIATQLASRLRQPPPGPEDVVAVATLHASRGLPRGGVALLRLQAVTEAGAIAERLLLLHVGWPAARPSSRKGLRADVQALLPAIEAAAVGCPTVSAWFTAVTAGHQTSVDLRLRREAQLAERGLERRELQPGLFDRALELEIRATDAHGPTGDGHERHLARLRANRPVRLQSALGGLLVVWR